LPERLARLRKAEPIRLLAQRSANVALLHHRDSHFRSIVRRHARESDLTSPVPFVSPYAQFEARSLSRSNRRGKGRPLEDIHASVIRSIVQSAASIAPNIAAGNAGGCDFIVSWTIQDPLSLALQFKPVGIERPDGHLTEGAHNGRYFSPDLSQCSLKATRGPPLRVDQIFEKVRPPTHGNKFPRTPWFF